LVFATAAALLAWSALEVARGRVSRVVRGVGITIPAALVVLFTLWLGDGLWIRWFLAVVILLVVASTLRQSRDAGAAR
jgi:membrane protein required for beta-lactamase induction